MRTRHVALALALGTTAAVGGAVAANAALSPGSGTLLCLPASGAVKAGTHGSCPAGYTRVLVANQAQAAAVTSQVNALTTFVERRFPFSSASSAQLSNGNLYVFGNGYNALPGASFTLTLLTTPAGKSLTTRTVRSGIVGQDGTFVGSATIRITCSPGDRYSARTTTKDSFGVVRVGKSIIATCPS